MWVVLSMCMCATSLYCIGNIAIILVNCNLIVMDAKAAFLGVDVAATHKVGSKAYVSICDVVRSTLP